jgi:hypothetical protein
MLQSKNANLNPCKFTPHYNMGHAMAKAVLGNIFLHLILSSIFMHFYAYATSVDPDQPALVAFWSEIT